MSRPIVLSFSGGKDSSYALYTLQQDPEWDVVRLLTTATREYCRSSMHGIRIDLLKNQADAIGIPLDIIWMDVADGGNGYQSKMEQALKEYKDAGIEHVAFGDLYLEDVRAYREKMNSEMGIHSIFPIWGRPTKEFAMEFISTGFKSTVVCVDTTQLDASFCGREYDTSFLESLPHGVDWCAEKGEFHTFCYQGPIFQKQLSFSRGEHVLRDERFYYSDLLPV